MFSDLMGGGGVFKSEFGPVWDTKSNSFRQPPAFTGISIHSPTDTGTNDKTC